MIEDNQKSEEGEFALIPLESGQHAVTPVPKATTDLPFFYLTKHKERLSKPIVYEGVDGDGRPIRWAATPNAAIGSPGIDAHEAWTRLVKPTWEAYRTAENRLPNILPLGGVRQCLRAVGWGQGGWEARRLLRALNQIGATWCTADFSVPTSKLGDDGRPTFRTIKGAFSRMTIFAIGEKHLSEEELKDGTFAFEFNLEDTLYIQFHPFEVAIQESQPQRYLDNLYMFSVAPAARRWYELMAAKMFGVVKNNGKYCEMLYSWYVKHHHTLNRLTTRRRIVQQIKEVVREHLDSGFIDRVAFARVSEPGKEIDFLIRFYPGSAARESIHRVASTLQKKRKLPAGEPRVFFRKRKQQGISTTNEEADSENVLIDESEAVRSESIEESLPESTRTLVDALAQRGIFRSQAVRLASTFSEERVARALDQIEYWDALRKTKEVGPGLLYDLVKNGEAVPATFETRRQREARTATETRRKNLECVNELVQDRYAAYCKQIMDDYVDTMLPAAELESRVAARKEEILKEPGFWGERPDLAEQLARHDVRAEVCKGVVVVSADEFRQAELPRVLAELNLNGKELGLVPAEPEAHRQQDRPPEPVDGSISREDSETGVPSILE